MYSNQQRNEIVNNFLELIDNPPQCPCCEISKNNNYINHSTKNADHIEICFGDESITLGDIVDVKVANIEGYIDMVTKEKIIFRADERYFEDFLSCGCC
jgi:hypothetical protein